MQLAGIDPYRYVPLDPALDRLRDVFLFPPGERTMINRPTVPTIYPPGAQLWFTIVGLLTPVGGRARASGSGRARRSSGRRRCSPAGSDRIAAERCSTGPIR